MLYLLNIFAMLYKINNLTFKQAVFYIIKLRNWKMKLVNYKIGFLAGKNPLKTAAYVIFCLTFGVLSSFEVSAYAIGVVVGKNKTKTSTSNQEKMCILRTVAQSIHMRHPDVNVMFVENERSVVGSALAAQKLIDKNVDLALLPLLSHEAEAAVELLMDANIPYMTTATARRVIKPGSFGLSTMPSNMEQAELLAEYYTRHHSGKKIYVVTDPGRPYSRSISDMFIHAVNVLEPSSEIVKRTYHPANIQNLAYQIKEGEVVFAALYNPNIASLYLAFAEHSRAPVTILGPDSVGGRQEFFEIIGKSADHISLKFIKNWDRELKGENKDELARIVEAECPNGKNTFLTTYSYDLINAAVAQLDKIKTTSTPAETIQLLKESPFITTMDGERMNFSEDGYNQKNLYLYEAAGTKLQLVETLKHD